MLRHHSFTAFIFALVLTLSGCGGGSEIGDFEHLEKTGVVGGPTSDIHWELLVQQTDNQLLLTYRNAGHEDLQWIRFQATHNDKNHFLFIDQDVDLSNGTLLVGEQHRITIDTPQDLQYPLFFWATFVTIHEITVEYCVLFNENKTQVDCEYDAPPPPQNLNNSYFES